MRVTGVSFSSDKKLARCEMQFSYRYDQKLQPRIKSKGLYTGDLLHQLLEAHYKKIDWNRKLKQLKKELWDPLFDEEKEHLIEKGFNLDYISSLFSHYVEHWESQDSKWEIIQVEKDYEIPTKCGIPIRFKADLIVKEGKRIILVETKNKKNLPDSEERILTPQVHSYCFLLKQVGIKVDSILWNYLKTEPVTKPQILKSGELSKRKINTDQRTYLKVLKEAGIHPKGDEAIGLNNYVNSLPETLSLMRITNIPNLKVGESFVKDWVERARRAREIKRPLRNWTKDCKWDCDYKALCEADMTGKPDRDTIIKKDFVQISKREVEVVEVGKDEE